MASVSVAPSTPARGGARCARRTTLTMPGSRCCPWAHSRGRETPSRRARTPAAVGSAGRLLGPAVRHVAYAAAGNDVGSAAGRAAGRESRSLSGKCKNGERWRGPRRVPFQVLRLDPASCPRNLAARGPTRRAPRPRRCPGPCRGKPGDNIQVQPAGAGSSGSSRARPWSRGPRHGCLSLLPGVGSVFAAPK